MRDVALRQWARVIQASLRLREDFAFAVVDVFVIVAGYTMATTMRLLDGQIDQPARFWSGLGGLLPILVAVHLIANILSGAYGHMWEYASISEARRVIIANAFAGLTVILVITPLADSIQTGPRGFPYSVAVSGAVIVFLGMGLVRFRSRLFSLRRVNGQAVDVPTLVVGRGKEAADFVREVTRLGQSARVMGFVSADRSATNKRLAGLPILGSVIDIPDLVGQHGIEQVVVAGALDDSLLRRVVDVCTDVDVRLRVAPNVGSVLDRSDGPIDVRDIEFQDLLPRPEVATDLQSVAELVAGRRVLVTGAGGSIGSEIVKQVLSFAPAAVIALDSDETHLHEGMLRWGGSPLVEIVLCDIRDADKLARTMARHYPEVVFHAAALKHVPVLEHFPEEAIATNVIGTRNVIEAVSQVGADRFVLISTDKAVEPSSVMGATKRIAEMLTQLANTRRDGCVYTSVRFGNVLGSRGSVVPTFVHQIHSGGPVTITDPAMTRYFMTVPEAVQLVLQAAALARGGEVFVLDMGDPVRVLDIARRMIRLAGLVPGRDIEIVTTGMRPGEKLSEVLAEVPMSPSQNPKINVAYPPAAGAAVLGDAIRELVGLASTDAKEDIRLVVKQVAALTSEHAVVDLRSIEREDISSWI
jgi:FlaA1/EpsC-like NDP-sugar epimerase